MIPAANREIAVVRGTYLQISAEKEVTIGQCAAEHRVLVTVWYYAMKLPVPLTKAVGLAMHIRKIVSM